MNHSYRSVIASLLFPILGIGTLSAQPEFLQCASVPESLCVQDEGIRLPANNQIYLGEGHPDATSCSVHVTQKKNVLSTCGGSLQYEVQLFLNDTSSAYILKPLTSIIADSNGMAELYFATEESPDAQISASGIPYTTGCLRYHRIRWIVTDTCGTESICDQYINLYDCQKANVSAIGQPSPYIFTDWPYIYAYGEDLVLAADDCTKREEFLVSFDSLSHQPNKEFYFCDIPGFGIEFPHNVWIADRGIDSNCDGVITWLERNIEKQEVLISFIDHTQVIDCFFQHTIEGRIKTEQGEGIKNVLVEFSSPGQLYPTYVTGDDGKYSFQVENINGEATISARRNDFHRNGVSTLDLVKIQKHILGIELFTSPYQTIAADANNSQFLSAIDLVQIRKLILGIDTEFPNNQSWRFVWKDYIFGDTIHPWPIFDKEIITITDIENPGNTDFVGIKIGDINGTAKPDFADIKPRGALQPFRLLTTELSYKTGEIIQVPIRMSSGQALIGFQFTLHTNGMEILDVLPGRISLKEGDYALFDDKMTISWFDENNVDVTNDEILITLVLKAKQNGNLSQSLQINSDITEAEIYLDGEQTFIPVLNVLHPYAEAALEIVSCSPNPWKDETTVFFYLPKTSNVTYNVMDVNGRKVYSDNEYLTEGYHNYTLKAADFSADGILFLEVNAGGSRMVEKMVLME